MQNLPFLKNNILLIEDNPGDIVLIEDYLAGISPDITITVSKTFAAAEEFLNNPSETFDLILLDLKLPDKEGEDLIRAILSLSGQSPVIVLTGHSDMEFSIRSLSLGVSDYLIKDDLNVSGLWKSISYSIERNEASRKLQESEQRYRYLFENNPVSILIWNLKTRTIIDSNQEAESKYGYTKDEFKRLKIDTIQKDGFGDYFPSETTNFREGMDLNMAGGISKHIKKNGEMFFAEMTGHFIKYHGEPSVLLLINDVTDKVEMQEQLLESTIRAEEVERNRIATELHDGIVQQLVACGMFTQTLAKKVEKDDGLSKEVNRLYDLLIKTTIQTRDISHNLKSAEFENTSLAYLLQQLLRQLSNASSINFFFNNHLGYDLSYGITVRTNVYRCVQELCNNIIKHSDASEAVLTIEEIDGTLFLTIRDDGYGFEYSGKSTIGLGLKNVESRILRLGGKIDFESGKKNGFLVNLEIPVNKEKV